MRPYPKIELHVHLEGTVRAHTLLEIARRNDYALPADRSRGSQSCTASRDFRHFIEVWILTTNALRTEDGLPADGRRLRSRGASHGAVYLEGIFSPAERCARLLVGGRLRGLLQRRAGGEELHGVEVRLTPDIPRGFTQEEARKTVEWSQQYRDRGVVGVGLGGLEAEFPPEPYETVFAHAKSLGLGSVPHAGEVAGAGVGARRARALGPTGSGTASAPRRIPASSRELAGRGTVLDVCPLSNLRTGAVASLADHPLPRLVAAGVRCSISTDDPAMFDTDLTPRLRGGDLVRPRSALVL